MEAEREHNEAEVPLRSSDAFYAYLGEGAKQLQDREDDKGLLVFSHAFLSQCKNRSSTFSDTIGGADKCENKTAKGPKRGDGEASGGVPERLDVEQWYDYLAGSPKGKGEEGTTSTCYTFPTVFIPVNYNLALALKKNCERFRKGTVGMVQLDEQEQKLLDEVYMVIDVNNLVPIRASQTGPNHHLTYTGI